jgi:osmotically-inducible protein OsmY
MKQDNRGEDMKIFRKKYPGFAVIIVLILSFFFINGCTPLWIGAGAAGGYIIASDERSMGRRIDDSVITTKVKSKLLADSTVKGFKIDVDTLEGEVTLTGLVSTRAEGERAIELARGVKGVVKVKDNIKVRE